MKSLSARIWDKYSMTINKSLNTADDIELARLNGKADGLIWAYSESLKELR